MNNPWADAARPVTRGHIIERALGPDALAPIGGRRKPAGGRLGNPTLSRASAASGRPVGSLGETLREARQRSAPNAYAMDTGMDGLLGGLLSGTGLESPAHGSLAGPAGSLSHSRLGSRGARPTVGAPEEPAMAPRGKRGRPLKLKALRVGLSPAAASPAGFGPQSGTSAYATSHASQASFGFGPESPALAMAKAVSPARALAPLQQQAKLASRAKSLATSMASSDASMADFPATPSRRAGLTAGPVKPTGRTPKAAGSTRLPGPGTAASGSLESLGRSKGPKPSLLSGESTGGPDDDSKDSLGKPGKLHHLRHRPSDSKALPPKDAFDPPTPLATQPWEPPSIADSAPDPTDLSWAPAAAGVPFAGPSISLGRSPGPPLSPPPGLKAARRPLPPSSAQPAASLKAPGSAHIPKPHLKRAAAASPSGPPDPRSIDQRSPRIKRLANQAQQAGPATLASAKHPRQVLPSAGQPADGTRPPPAMPPSTGVPSSPALAHDPANSKTRPVSAVGTPSRVVPGSGLNSSAGPTEASSHSLPDKNCRQMSTSVPSSPRDRKTSAWLGGPAPHSTREQAGTLTPSSDEASPSTAPATAAALGPASHMVRKGPPPGTSSSRTPPAATLRTTAAAEAKAGLASSARLGDDGDCAPPLATGSAAVPRPHLGCHAAAGAHVGAAGADTAGVGAAGADTAGVGAAGADTAGVGAAGADTAVVGAAGADTAGVGAAGADTAGVGAAGADTAGVGASGAGPGPETIAPTDGLAPATGSSALGLPLVVPRLVVPPLRLSEVGVGAGAYEASVRSRSHSDHSLSSDLESDAIDAGSLVSNAAFLVDGVTGLWAADQDLPELTVAPAEDDDEVHDDDEEPLDLSTPDPPSTDDSASKTGKGGDAAESGNESAVDEADAEPPLDEDAAGGDGPWPCEACLGAGSLGCHASALRGHLRCLTELLGSDGTDFVEFDARGRSPLFYAASAGMRKCCSALVDYHSDWVTCQDSEGNTALSAACASGHTTVATVLLESGADPSAVSSRGLTPAHVAKTPSLIHLLASYGAPLEAKDKAGRTPLFVACALGRRSAAEMLLELDTTMTLIEDQDERGDRPLLAAAANGHKHVVRLLLGHGAEWGGTNHKSLIAEDVARVNGHDRVFRLLRRVRLADERAAQSNAKEAYAGSLLTPTPGADAPKGDLFTPARVSRLSTIGEHKQHLPREDGQGPPAGEAAATDSVNWSTVVIASSGPWAAFWDPNHSAVYYVHGPSGQSQWDSPADEHGPVLAEILANQEPDQEDSLQE